MPRCPSPAREEIVIGLTGGCREDWKRAESRSIVRWDGVNPRVSLTCRADERNVLANFVVILADQPTERPWFFRRKFEALRLPYEVTDQGIASSRR